MVAQEADLLLDPVDITATLSRDGSTIITVNARVTNLGLSAVDTYIFRVDSLDMNVLSATVNGSTTGAYANRLERYTEIVVSLPVSLDSNESVWITLRARAYDFQSDLVAGTDPTRLISDFIFYVRPLDSFYNFTFTAVLPSEALLSQESIVPIFPECDSNYTDGVALSFVWFTQMLHPGQERVFIIKYQLPNFESGGIGSSSLCIVLAGFIGIAGGIALTIFGPKVYHRIRRIGKVRFIGVTSEEEEILEILREKGGSCSQKDLYRDLEMSQAKVSIILNNLEERGLVRRFREGRENIVHLMEE